MAMTMNNAAFCDVVPCGFIIIRRFGRTCRLHLQGNHLTIFLARVISSTEYGGYTFLRNVSL
jgi:hypothetical protein